MQNTPACAMSYPEREFLFSRILSGTVRIKIYNDHRQLERYYIAPYSSYELYIAMEMYNEALERASLNGAQSEDDVLDLMLRKKLWTLDEQKELDDIEKDIEDLKVRLYDCLNKSNSRLEIRTKLKEKKERYQTLYGRRHSLDYLSPAGIASITKNYYLLGRSLRRDDGSRVFGDDSFMEQESSLLDKIIDAQESCRIQESQFRELARTDPWRSFWIVSKTKQWYDNQLPTHDQRTLQTFSVMYDNIYESTECPHESVVDDDDMLDGWMISQRRLRESKQLQKQGDEIVKNKKVANSDSIFIPAETLEDARKITAMNSKEAELIRRSRMEKIRRLGEVSEQQMPDTKMKILESMSRMPHRAG